MSTEPGKSGAPCHQARQGDTCDGGPEVSAMWVHIHLQLTHRPHGLVAQIDAHHLRRRAGQGCHARACKLRPSSWQKPHPMKSLFGQCPMFSSSCRCPISSMTLLPSSMQITQQVSQLVICTCTSPACETMIGNLRGLRVQEAVRCAGQ